MAWADLMEFWQGWSENSGATLKSACDRAERSVALDNREYQGHWAAAWCYRHTQRPDDERRALEATFRLNPLENAVVLNYATNVLMPEGRLDEAITRIRRIERANPKGRVIDKIYNALSTLYFEQGEYKSSFDYLRKMSPDFAKGTGFRLRRVAALHYLGRKAQARSELAAFVADHPTFTPRNFSKSSGLPPKSAKAFLQALEAVAPDI